MSNEESVRRTLELLERLLRERAGSRAEKSDPGDRAPDASAVRREDRRRENRREEDTDRRQQTTQTRRPAPSAGGDVPSKEARPERQAAVFGEEDPAGDNGVQPYRRLTTRLGTLLVDEGLISGDDLDRALEEHEGHGERLGHYLVEKGLVDEQDLMLVLAKQYGVPAAELDEVQVDDEVLDLVPVEMARRYLVVPLTVRKDALEIAMVDPTDVVAIANLKFATNLRPQPLIATERAVLDTIRRLYGSTTNEHPAASQVREDPLRESRREIRRLIRKRDQAIMEIGTDARAAYRLAVEVDQLVDEIAELLRSDSSEDEG